METEDETLGHFARSKKKISVDTGRILDKVEQDPDLDLQKKRTSDLQKSLYQNSLHQLKTHFLTSLRVMISKITIGF